MKKNIFHGTIPLILMLIPIVFQGLQASIIGRIIPSNAADEVLAIAKNDTLHWTMRAVIINGRFDMDLKPGVYKITIESHMPFKNYTFESIEVKPGYTTDLGDIRIQ